MAVQLGINSDLLVGTVTAYSSMTSIGDVFSVAASFEADEVDVTPITSNGHRVYIAGLRSATIQFDIGFDETGGAPSTTTIHNYLLNQWQDGGTNYYGFLPPNATTSNMWIGEAIITGYDVNETPDDKVGATIRLRISDYVQNNTSGTTYIDIPAAS